jgi:hypothetical protein
MMGRIGILGLLLAGMAVGGYGQSTSLALPAATIDAGTTVYWAPVTITNTSTFVVELAATVTFQAGTSITLTPGFHAVAAAGTAGMVFHALIAPSTGASEPATAAAITTTQDVPAVAPTKEYIYVNGRVVAIETMP